MEVHARGIARPCNHPVLGISIVAVARQISKKVNINRQRRPIWMTDALEVRCGQPNKFSAEWTSIAARQNEYLVGCQNASVISEIIYLAVKWLYPIRVRRTYDKFSGCVRVGRPRWVSYIIHYRLCNSSVVDGRIVSCSRIVVR